MISDKLFIYKISGKKGSTTNNVQPGRDVIKNARIAAKAEKSAVEGFQEKEVVLYRPGMSVNDRRLIDKLEFL